MTDRRSDRLLADAAVTRGDEAAFRILYRRHTPALYRMAVRCTADRGGVADDLVQDTWLRAMGALARFEWRSGLGTWLAGILFNRIRELRRAAAWTAPEPEPWEPPAPQGDPEARIDLEAAIARLAPGYRAVLVLHDVEGFTHAEIAAILGIEAGTSKSQLSRARQQIRQWLQPGIAS